MYEVHYTLPFGRDPFLLVRSNFGFMRGTPDHVNQIAGEIKSWVGSAKTTGISDWAVSCILCNSRYRAVALGWYRRESETVASATLGRSQDVCEGARFPVEGERCVVSD